MFVELPHGAALVNWFAIDSMLGPQSGFKRLGLQQPNAICTLYIYILYAPYVDFFVNIFQLEMNINDHFYGFCCFAKQNSQLHIFIFISFFRVFILKAFLSLKASCGIC